MITPDRKEYHREYMRTLYEQIIIHLLLNVNVERVSRNQIYIVHRTNTKTLFSGWRL